MISITVTPSKMTEREIRELTDYMLTLAMAWAEPSDNKTLVAAAHPLPMGPIVSAQAIVTPPAPAGIDVDSAGLPWEGRIHSATRAKSENGTWRRRRGVDDLTFNSVTLELQKTMGVLPVGATAVAPIIPAVPATIIAPPPVAVPVNPFAATGVPTPPAPFVQPVAPPVPQVNTTETGASAGVVSIASPSEPSVGAIISNQPTASAPTFPQLMQAITKAYGAKQVTQEQIQAAVASAGLTSLPMVASRPELITAVAAGLGLIL